MGADDHSASPRDDSGDLALERVARDLDALYNRGEPPARLLLAQDWTRATSTGNHMSVIPTSAVSQSVGGSAMSPRKRPNWTRRVQVFTATAAALVIVGLLAVLLTHITPGKSPAGTTATTTGDAAFLQLFAQKGGVSVTLHYFCSPTASQCNPEALLPQLEAALNKRLAGATGVTAVWIQPQGDRTLTIKVIGVKDDGGIATLIGSPGQLNIVDTGSTQLNVGQQVTVCADMVQNCPAGAYHVVFRGQQIDPNSVSAGLDQQTNQPVVSFAFNSATRAAFATFTRTHIGQNLTITLDNTVIESATIQSEIDGQAQITGLASAADAQRLAVDVKNGPLPLSVFVQTHLAEGPIVCSGSTVARPSATGGAGITPHIAHPAAGQPAYTADDVRAYVLAHPDWPATARASIVQIYQISALQAAALTDGECTGLPDGNPVFVVTLTGNFPPVDAPGSNGPAKPVSTADEVFDGLSGNLIETGNLPK
jgi:hypothetical protein